MKPLIIALVVLVALFGGWKIFASRVDRTNPESVARAFLTALKSHDVSKAGKYWLPDGAEAWKTSAQGKLDGMQSGTFTRFFDDLPDASVSLVSAPRDPKTPNEQTIICGNTAVDLRLVDGKWYISKSAL